MLVCVFMREIPKNRATLSTELNFSIKS
ncbi:hypothetical protein S1OALGB6SA_218, partial [Olavius algarvensis spirochete endosymbiont]